VLAALTEGDGARAAARAAAAEKHQGGGLLSALASYLGGMGKGDVYAEPTAFEAFLAGGDNPQLYARATDELSAVHREVRPARVLDIGCGDGRLTSAVLSPATSSVTLVDPSPAMLAAARVSVQAHTRASVAAHGRRAADFIAESMTDDWDLAQATFSMHTMDRLERHRVLAWLSERAPLLALVEFDVPELEPGSPAHLEHLALRYELGVRMYGHDRVVVEAFLLPVLVGQLDPSRKRHTYEQPITSWRDELESAGYAVTAQRHVFDHWWAPAHLVLASR
jgi:SAM-dependent methyltransferase